ncbi:MAG: NAD(P)-binding domain-containing protein, partial [Paracoccaceae bacterium]|nr:NAD(P)-binding domain-containing protein [Paracoccaceae bacterium]
MTKRIGFIGLGDMGTPMARRLIDTGSDLGVWTRSAEKRAEFSKTGAIAAENPKQLFELCDVVIIMLASADVLDEVLERGTEQFNELVRDCILIQMGTTVPDYSRGLEADILKAGGRYAEVPVSGSSVPAASGQLVAMQACDPETLMAIDAVIAPLIAAKVDCGP